MKETYRLYFPIPSAWKKQDNRTPIDAIGNDIEIILSAGTPMDNISSEA